MGNSRHHHGRRDATNDAWLFLFFFLFFPLLLRVQNLSRGVERTRKMPLFSTKRRQAHTCVGFPERKKTWKRKTGKTFDDDDDESERRGRMRRGETRYGRV